MPRARGVCAGPAASIFTSAAYAGSLPQGWTYARRQWSRPQGPLGQDRPAPPRRSQVYCRSVVKFSPVGPISAWPPDVRILTLEH